MKLFQKLVGRNKNGKRSPPESRPSSRQSSSNERRIPEFVGGDEADLEEMSEDNSLSYSSPSVRAPLAAARLNDEDKGLILSDDLSISRPEDNDPNFPTPSNGRRTHSRNNFDYDDGRNSGYSSPIVGAPSVRSMPSISSMPVPAHANDNVHRLYQAQSDHNLSRMESFRSIQSNVAPVPPSMNNNNQSFHIPAPMQQQLYNSPPPPPQSLAPPPSSSFSPQEIMEINRLMAIGYSYETALGMMGINGSPSMFPPPSSFPIPMPVPVPMPMMMPPPQYYPMMGSPYQPYYQPSPYQMAPPPMTSTPYSAAGRRDQFDESEMMLAIQQSIEEEDRRKQQMTDEERMVKEAVERANERAIQIALQRSFEEQYGPGSYQRYQEQQRLSRAMSAGDIPYNTTHHPVSPSPRINRQGTFDFNMIHNYGSADVDEEANPLREAIEEQFDQNRPGVYYHSPTRPLTSTNTASPRHSNAVNHIPSFMQQANDSFYEIPAEH